MANFPMKIQVNDFPLSIFYDNFNMSSMFHHVVANAGKYIFFLFV